MRKNWRLEIMKTNNWPHFSFVVQEALERRKTRTESCQVFQRICWLFKRQKGKIRACVRSICLIQPLPNNWFYVTLLTCLVSAVEHLGRNKYSSSITYYILKFSIEMTFYKVKLVNAQSTPSLLHLLVTSYSYNVMSKWSTHVYHLSYLQGKDLW